MENDKKKNSSNGEGMKNKKAQMIKYWETIGYNRLVRICISRKSVAEIAHYMGIARNTLLVYKRESKKINRVISYGYLEGRVARLRGDLVDVEFDEMIQDEDEAEAKHQEMMRKYKWYRNLHE